MDTVGQDYQSIRDFRPPGNAAGGPTFSCADCRRELKSYEWTREYDDPSGRTLELRCACGRRYRWTRDATTIEMLFNKWQRDHVVGTCAVTREPSGLFVFGVRIGDAAQIQWLGRSGSVEQAQQRADALVPAHPCQCPGWRGHA